MVMNDSRYGDMVPFAIGTIYTHAALNVIIDEEWKNLSLSWRCASLPTYVSKVAEMENFSLDSVRGNVKAHKATILPPFSTIFVKGKSTVKGHHKRVNVATEHSDDITNSNIAAVRSYSFIKPGSNKVTVSVRNLTSKEITLKAGTIIGQIEAANAVPPMLAPKSENQLELNKDVKSSMESIQQSITDDRQLASVLESNPPVHQTKEN